MGYKCKEIRYTEDTVVKAETEETLQLLMSALNTVSEKWRISIYARKTEVLVLSRKQNEFLNNIMVGRNKLKNVDSYMYFGQTINSNIDNSKEIKQRIEIARNAFFYILRHDYYQIAGK